MQGALLDRFGIVSGGTGGGEVSFSLDDLKYSAANPESPQILFVLEHEVNHYREMVTSRRVFQYGCAGSSKRPCVNVIEAGIWIFTFAGNGDAMHKGNAFKRPKKACLFDLCQCAVPREVDLFFGRIEVSHHYDCITLFSLLFGMPEELFHSILTL